MNDLNVRLRKTAARQGLEDDTAEGQGGQHGCCLCHPAASAVDGTEMSDKVRLHRIHLSCLPHEKTKARTDSLQREPKHSVWILITSDVFEEVMKLCFMILKSSPHFSSHAL